MIVQIHGDNLELTDAISEHIQRAAESALDRFEDRVARVNVTLSEVKHLGHAHHFRCHAVVEVRRRGTVVINHESPDLYAAVDLAMGRLKRTVRRKINRVRDAHRHEAQRN